MVGQTTLALSALVALAQSKAIVTNLCPHDLFVWSVPETAHIAKDLAIKPGKSYIEPFRSGTTTNPGIAIKISPRKNGINEGKDEITFAYTVDKSDPSKIWINLSNVRGKAFENVTLLTCHGPYQGPLVPTRQCSNRDDIELVLCGTERAAPTHDNSHPHVISNCSVSQAAPGEEARSSRPGPCSPRLVGPKTIPPQSKTDKHDVQHSKKMPQPLRTAAEPTEDMIVKDLCTLSEYTGNSCDVKEVHKEWHQVLAVVCRQTLPRETLTQCALALHGAAAFIRDGQITFGSFRLGRNEVQPRGPAVSDWPYTLTCQTLGSLSGTAPTPDIPIGYDCDKIISDLQTKATGKNPQVNIGWYVDERLPGKNRNVVESALDKYFDQINWSDSSGSGTDYGWNGPSKEVQARRPKRSFQETCDLLLKMFGGTDCKKRALELKGAAKRYHPSQSNPEVHFSQRFSNTGVAGNRKEKRHLRKDLKQFFTDVSWSDSAGSGTPYGNDHETKVLSTRSAPKVSHEEACAWILTLFTDEGTGDCEAIATGFKSEKKIYLGKQVKALMPGVRSKDVEKVFDYYWPGVEWSDDES